MIKNFVKKITRTFFPKDSQVDRKIKQIGIKLSLASPPIDHDYHAWSVRKEPDTFSELTKNQEIKFTIVTPAFNTPSKYLEPLLYSVINQTYSNWEWIVVNASSDKERSDRIKQLKETDLRIKLFKVNNKGISENTNVGLSKASGDYIIFLDHDDTLAPEALNELAITIQDNKQPDLVYSDEDKLIEDGSRRRGPHIKSNFSIDMLRNVNYITHITCIKKIFLDKIGYLNTEYDGAQDYDLLLRAADSTSSIVRVPKILYHWREAQASTAADFSVKPEIISGGIKALQNHLKRNKISGSAEAIPAKPGYYRVRYKFTKKTIAEVARPTAKSSFKNAEYVLIVDKNVVRADGWQEELGGLLDQDSGVGIAFPIVINQHMQVVDAGQRNAVSGKFFYGIDFPENTYYGDTDWYRGQDVCGSVLLTRTELLREFFVSNSKFSASSYSSFVKSKGKRIVLCGVDPWILRGNKIGKKNIAKAYDIKSYKEYHNA